MDPIKASLSGSSQQVSPEDGDKIQFPKRHALNESKDDG
jgi:hypothetical protein